MTDMIHELEGDSGDALPALEEPDVVAAAVAALVKPADTHPRPARRTPPISAEGDTMTIGPDRLHSLFQATAMVAPDTYDILADRATRLFEAGRSITTVRFFPDNLSTLRVEAGLTLRGTPEARRSAGSRCFAALFRGGSTPGIIFSPPLDNSVTEEGLWTRFHTIASRRDLTQVEIIGGREGDAPTDDDRLTVNYWNQSGVCCVETVVFDNRSRRPCTLNTLREQLDGFMANLPAQQPDVRAMLEALQTGLRTHRPHAHAVGGAEAMTDLIIRYGDERENVAGAMEHAGPDEVRQHHDLAQQLLAQIRGRLLEGDDQPCP